MTVHDSSTRLRLLAHDGVISVTFTPMLLEEQYNSLLAVELKGIRTKAGLSEALRQFAHEHRLVIDLEST